MSSVPDAKPRPLRRRKAGDLGAVRRVLWGALLATEAVMLDPEAAPADVLRGAHALATLAGAYARVHEQAELLPRLELVETVLAKVLP